MSIFARGVSGFLYSIFLFSSVLALADQRVLINGRAYIVRGRDIRIGRNADGSAYIWADGFIVYGIQMPAAPTTKITPTVPVRRPVPEPAAPTPIPVRRAYPVDPAVTAIVPPENSSKPSSVEKNKSLHVLDAATEPSGDQWAQAQDEMKQEALELAFEIPSEILKSKIKNEVVEQSRISQTHSIYIAQTLSSNIGILTYLYLKTIDNDRLLTLKYNAKNIHAARKIIKESIALSLWHEVQTKPQLEFEGEGKALKFNDDTLRYLQSLSEIAFRKLLDKIDGAP